jgi:hypothetical protein
MTIIKNEDLQIVCNCWKYITFDLKDFDLTIIDDLILDCNNCKNKISLKDIFENRDKT